MNEKRKSPLGVFYTLLLLVAIIILFWWYTSQNSRRIETQNLNYAADSAQQTAEYIAKEFQNAKNRISTYSYFLGESLSEQRVDAKELSEMVENSLFDSFIYTDTNGISTLSDGRTADTSGREYFAEGMKGETGMSVETDSPLFEETVITFYSPVYHQGVLMGVLEGIYSADSYLYDMLDVSYFGENADVFLCMQDGTKIACSDQQDDTENIFEMLIQTRIIDQDLYQEIEEVFQEGGEGFYISPDGTKTDNVCVINLSESGYILVQMFPKNVTQTMIKNANRTGSILETILIILFVIYIFILLARSKKKRNGWKRKTGKWVMSLGA